ARDPEHFAHAGPAARPFIPNHDHVAGPNRLTLHRLERRFLAVVYPGRAPMHSPTGAGNLDHSPFGRQIPAQDDETPCVLYRLIGRPHDLLPRRFDRHLGLDTYRTATDGRRIAYQDARVEQPSRNRSEERRVGKEGRREWGWGC